MFAASAWFLSTLHASRRWLRPEHAPGARAPSGDSRGVGAADAGKPRTSRPARGAPGLVPIRGLGPVHRERIRGHLLALEPGARFLRFGHHASDEQIQRYVQGLDFGRDEVFGIFNRRLELIALAHLALPGPADPAVPGTAPRRADLGVSVLARARGRGLGRRLFDRAVMHARNAGVDQLLVQALSANAAMLHIARRAGARVQRSGPESEACLQLPPATLQSRLHQWHEARLGETDYRLKRDSKRFWDWVSGLQQLRGEIQKGRLPTGR